MKFLSDYMNDKQTKLFKKCGAFFAFSSNQFNNSAKKDVKYNNLGSGMICPVDNAKELITGLDSIYTDAVKQDLAENGAKAIIHRELENYECQITCDYSEVIEILSPYGISEQDIQAEWQEFWDECVKNNWF